MCVDVTDLLDVVTEEDEVHTAETQLGYDEEQINRPSESESESERERERENLD